MKLEKTPKGVPKDIFCPGLDKIKGGKLVGNYSVLRKYNGGHKI